MVPPQVLTGSAVAVIAAGKVSVNTNTGTVPGSNRYGQNVVGTDVNEPTSLLVVNTGGIFNTAVNITVGSLNGTGGSINMPSGKTLTIGALGTTDSFAGVIAGAARLTKTGSGTTPRGPTVPRCAAAAVGAATPAAARRVIAGSSA